MKRTLVLRREQLSDISATELAEVAGAASAPGNTCNCPDYTWSCLTGPCICRDSRVICS